MNKQRYLDLSVGFFMLAGLAAFLVLAFQVSGVSSVFNQGHYEVTADFADVGGLKRHAPVTIAGVKVGEVTNIILRPEQLNARVTMNINNNTRIPYEDASARILTEGLLGSNYISIVPGFDDDKSHPFLRNGDEIAKTQEAIILENLVGQLLFNVKK